MRHRFAFMCLSACVVMLASACSSGGSNATPTTSPTSTATPTPTSSTTPLPTCSSLTLTELAHIALQPATSPSRRDVDCVMYYLYAATRLSAGTFAVQTVTANHTSAAPGNQWGSTVTTTWDGHTGLIYSPSDTALPKQYFDMQGNIGAEPSTDVNRSVSTVASLYHSNWTDAPKTTWSWKRLAGSVQWTLVLVDKHGPRTVTATFNSSGFPSDAATFGTDSMPTTGSYTSAIIETITPYSGPPIIAQ